MEEQVHKRRERYKGTHPKSYKEKYKELQPEKYAADVEKIKQKGKTPAGMHISICVKEILDILSIKPGQTGLDVTLGYGGHTLEMLKCLNGKGHLYGLDADPIEIEKTRERLMSLGFTEDIFTAKNINFSEIKGLLPETGCFDFVLADLGVSSMQIDNPERGFTFKKEGPLDLRLNPQAGISASQRLLEMSKEEIHGMLTENADEPYAEQIARGIITAKRSGTVIDTTTKLKNIIEQSLSFLPKGEKKELVKKSCQRTFQALRIDVNNEYEVLYKLLENVPLVLAPGGRVAILSFHSGEDRLVKKSFKQFFKEGLYSEISTDIIRPSAEECAMNSRARSAKLRFAVRAL